MTPQMMQDNSTVFSILPRDINTVKPGIYPGNFHIDACFDIEKPSRLLIPKPSQHMMIIGGKKDPIMIPTATYTLAESIVKDYISTQLWISTDAKPGLTWIQGNISIAEFVTKFKEEHQKIKDQQKRWFFNYVKQTDAFWAQSKHSPKVISDTARYAAKFLGLEKDWCKDDIVAMEFVNCPACLAKVNPRLAVCNVCFKGVINKEVYEELKKSGQLVA